MPHGILDECGGACRRCQTSLLWQCPLPPPMEAAVWGGGLQSRLFPGHPWEGMAWAKVWNIGQGEFEPYSQRPCVDQDSRVRTLNVLGCI